MGQATADEGGADVLSDGDQVVDVADTQDGLDLREKGEGLCVGAEALADLLMTPGSLLGLVPSLPSLIGVVVRRGIDYAWLAQPPVHVARDDRGRWQIAVTDATDVTVFSQAEISGLVSRLQSQYGRTG
ncbi:MULTISPECIES: hypothetical protein [unclassified Streptomyces]|uniref:hypothetical protein n=1 Tax=unclassified Streptomyces TaxID=2593676 RepID=UPI00225A6BF6|nr:MULTISPECIES: hypothetical protein [unclassified Streptomyces]MCX4407041.1 hypothetical protein [Streptomyces sp. NBC_01764]MCX5188271.1 hypothetical protein [Streptomyces sp. NBC_00268]